MFHKNLFLTVTLLGCATFAANVATAHHSRAMYDQTKTIEITGSVKEFQFVFPHSWLLVLVTKPDGTTTTWGIEAAGPPNLVQSGIHKGDFPPGTKVSAQISPMRDGEPRGLWKQVKRLSDGKVFIETFGPTEKPPN